MSGGRGSLPYDSLLFGTTSYVLPADILPNVRLLAPHVDDIEVILFEGEWSNLPSRADVREIGMIAEDGGCGFTIHLPLDVGIGESDPEVRHRAQETCLRVIDLTLSLEPHAFVVHPELPLRYHPAFGDAPQPLFALPVDVFAAWQAALGESFGRLAAEAGPFPLAVENLQFPFGWVSSLLEEHDLGVTLDVGHLLMHGGDVAGHVREFGDRLTVVHFHGIQDGKDHRPIGAFDRGEMEGMLRLFDGAPTRRPPHPTRRATGRGGRVVVSLEVFGWRPTTSSLATLADVLGDGRGDALRRAVSAIMEELPRWDPDWESDPV